MENKSIPTSQAPIAQPAMPPTQQPKQSSGPSLGIWIIVLFFIAAIVCAGAYFFVSSRRQSKPVVATAIPSPTLAVPSPEQEPVSTADWKTYTSSESAYTFKYPPTWDTLDVGPDILMAAPKEVTSSISQGRGAPGDGKYLAVVVHVPEQPYPDSTFKSDATKKVTEKTIMVGKISAKEYTSTYTELATPYYKNGEVTTQIIMEHKGKMYGLDLLLNPQEKTYQEILSSFAFLD